MDRGRVQPVGHCDAGGRGLDIHISLGYLNITAFAIRASEEPEDAPKGGETMMICGLGLCWTAALVGASGCQERDSGMTNQIAAKQIEAAIKQGDAAALRRLLEEDPARASTPLAGGLTPLLLALYHQRKDLVPLVREHCGDLGWFEAAAVGDAQRLKQQLAEGAVQINAHAADGFTALHLAAYFAQPEAVQVLIAAGATPDAVANNASRVRPIHSAAAGRNAEVARLLLEAGADANAVQHGGWTALQASAKCGDLDVVRVLLAHGADARQATENGQTALDFAADHPKVLALLRSNPSD